MSETFRKLNLGAQNPIAVLALPPDLDLDWPDTIRVVSDVRDLHEVTFALAFVKSQEELSRMAASLLPKLVPDAVLWFAYPKKSSTRYASDITRDQGWEPLRDAGMAPVRQVAIDQDWSALRFRRDDLVKRRTAR